jgi:hypothetical protein
MPQEMAEKDSVVICPEINLVERSTFSACTKGC